MQRITDMKFTSMVLILQNHYVLKNNVVMNAKIMSEHFMSTHISLTIKVVKNIAVKYPNITKGVQEIMGGQVLDYEAKRILNRGKKLGEETGRRQEQEAIVKRMILSGMETSVIMDLSMMTEEQIK